MSICLSLKIYLDALCTKYVCMYTSQIHEPADLRRRTMEILFFPVKAVLQQLVMSAGWWNNAALRDRYCMSCYEYDFLLYNELEIACRWGGMRRGRGRGIQIAPFRNSLNRDASFGPHVKTQWHQIAEEIMNPKDKFWILIHTGISVKLTSHVVLHFSILCIDYPKSIGNTWPTYTHELLFTASREHDPSHPASHPIGSVLPFFLPQSPCSSLWAAAAHAGCKCYEGKGHQKISASDPAEFLCAVC